MNTLGLKILQIIISCVLILLILIQSKGQGLSMGVSSAFSMYRSRRGVEKLVFMLTIIFTVLLIGNSLVILILSK